MTLVMNRLPGKMGRRKVHTKRYNKRVPGHHIQKVGVFMRCADVSMAEDFLDGPYGDTGHNSKAGSGGRA